MVLATTMASQTISTSVGSSIALTGACASLHAEISHQAPTLVLAWAFKSEQIYQRFRMKQLNHGHSIIAGATLMLMTGVQLSSAQTAPSSSDISSYDGLHEAAHQNDVDSILTLVKAGAEIDARDRSGRTPLIVAAFASNEKVVNALANAGADLNALEHSAYDIVTIAAVADDVDMLDLVLDLGANSGNVTSPL